MTYRNLQTGEIAPAHNIGTNDEGKTLYQFVEGWEPTFPYTTGDEDGNWIEITEICQSIGIREVAKEQGGYATLAATENVRGENYRLWDLPNGSRAIETNGDPLFEDADQVEFEELRREVFGE